MLVNITEGFLDGLAEVNDAFIDKFEELIVQHIKSFHYIALTRKVAKQIADILDARLSRKTKNALILISSQSDNSMTLLKKLRFYMEVRSCDETGLKVETCGNVKVWVCCIAYANQWCSHPSKIVSENISDGMACLEAGRHFSLINSYPKHMQKATLEMSGGCGNADRVLNQRLDDALAPVLCFIDSDKLCSVHQGSSAITKCIELIDKKVGVAVFHHTTARELENILPFKYIRLAIEELDTSVDRDSVLDNLFELHRIKQFSPNLYQYIDLKLGTCSTWIRKQSPDVISHYKLAEKIGQCYCAKDCEGLVSPPVINNILDKVITRMKASSPKEIKESVDVGADKEWLDFGEVVFSMGVVNNIRLT
jgi:hypothetical protein